MSEEIQNASFVVPRSVMTSIFINGSLGFGMLIATLSNLHDLDADPKPSRGLSVYANISNNPPLPSPGLLSWPPLSRLCSSVRASASLRQLHGCAGPLLVVRTDC